MEGIIENRIKLLRAQKSKTHIKNRNETIKVTWPWKEIEHISWIGGSINLLLLYKHYKWWKLGNFFYLYFKINFLMKIENKFINEIKEKKS